jgi:hypothetical protein
MGTTGMQNGKGGWHPKEEEQWSEGGKKKLYAKG